MLGVHSSHSYQNGTNLYFVYDYDVNGEPGEKTNLCHVPINAIVVEEHGSAYQILTGLKRTSGPNGIMNLGTVHPLKDR